MKKVENENKAKEVKLGETTEIELPSIDVSEYVGNDVQIVSVKEFEGKHGYFIQIKTEIVDTIETTEDKDNIELCGSRNFGLQQEGDNIGWGKNTNLGEYLAKMKVEHYNDLIGKTVKLQTVTTNGTDFLTFN